MPPGPLVVAVWLYSDGSATAKGSPAVEETMGSTERASSEQGKVSQAGRLRSGVGREVTAPASRRAGRYRQQSARITMAIRVMLEKAQPFIFGFVSGIVAAAIAGLAAGGS